MYHVLEAKYIEVFSESFGWILHWENAHRLFFFKEAFDVVSVALRPSLSKSSNLKCLGGFTAEVREMFAGNGECYDFFFFFFLPIGQSLNLVLRTQKSWCFFMFFFPLLFFPFHSVHVDFEGY